MRMHAGFVLVAGVVGVLSWSAAGARQLPFPIAVACKHDEGSTVADRTRRDDARALARAINRAQADAAAQTRQYWPLADLPGLPATPEGFQLRLYTDGAGYVLSIKDERDPCHYGIFSDQHGRLYEMSPQVPQAAS